MQTKQLMQTNDADKKYPIPLIISEKGYFISKVGSSVDEVIAAYGQPTLVGGDHYIYRSVSNPAVGFDFEIELNHVENIKCGLLQ